MLKYFTSRILEAIPVFFIIVTAVFFMVRFVPGGPFDKERAVSEETLAALNSYYGLDEPLVVQYCSFLKNLARGDLGPSFKYAGWSVNEILREKALVSLELGGCALAIALVLGLGVGFAAAAFPSGKIGAALSGISLVGICLPAFVLGPVLILIFCLRLNCFNAMGWSDFPSDIVLPAFTLALGLRGFRAAGLSRRNRAGTSGLLSQRDAERAGSILCISCATQLSL